MRYRLLECRSVACATATEAEGVCTAWIKTLSCTTTEKGSVYHHGAHAVVDQTLLNRMTLQLKRFTKNLAANGAKPMAIMSDMIDQFNLTEETVPSLGQVQRTAYHHKKVLLMATAFVSQMRETVRVHWFREDLDETTPFTFACPMDDFGIPVIGNGSEAKPFMIGVTTKRQVRGLYRAAEFPFHIDATYKLNQSGYPMVVCGISDASRSMHVSAVFLTSHLRQDQYASIFSSIFAVYKLITGGPLKLRYVMGDADDAQYNGFEEAVIPNCPSATYLMCFFHVMLNAKKRAKRLSQPERSLIYKHIYRIHHTRNQFDAEDEVKDALCAWSALPSLKIFLTYFKSEWLESRFHRWQCYQSGIAHAKTNNPLEQFNKAFKRDYTLRQLLPLNSVMLKMQQLCKTKAVVAQDFKESSVVTPDLPRRLKYLRKAGLLSHKRVQRASLSFIMDSNALETHVIIK
ncbi:hypothetical protein BBJ28_00025446 [Nothophytophthora sp. Chile5]|nr:hypothetical protein BBJ28_00025446 [Nothophytophthora sp. Chile5]